MRVNFRQHIRERQREIAADFQQQKAQVHADYALRLEDINAAIMERRNVFTHKRCLAAISSHYGVSEEDIMGVRRYRHVVEARQHLYWILRNERMDTSYHKVGKLVGRDHATVYIGILRFEYLQRREDIACVNKEVWRLYNDQISQTETA